MTRPRPCRPPPVRPRRPPGRAFGPIVVAIIVQLFSQETHSRHINEGITQVTDQPNQPPDDATALPGPTEPIASDRVPTAPAPGVHADRASRWEGLRPRGRLNRVAAILVSMAAAVFIVGAIFVAGFAAGSEGATDGGDGYGYGHSEGERHRVGDESGDRGSSRDGFDQEDPVRGSPTPAMGAAPADRPHWRTVGPTGSGVSLRVDSVCGTATGDRTNESDPAWQLRPCGSVSAVLQHSR
ncbi:hypothetical protein JCM12141A_57640 [Mycolicibacterium hodleri]